MQIKGAGPSHPTVTLSPTTVIPAQPPSFPRKRESRDGPGVGYSHSTQTQNPPNYRKVPETTGNYRLWRFFRHDGSLRRVRKPATHRHPQPTHRHSRPHRHSRESGNPGMGGARGIPTPHSQPDNHPNYRKVPETTGYSDSYDTMDPFEESGNPPRLRHSRESGNPGMGRE